MANINSTLVAGAVLFGVAMSISSAPAVVIALSMPSAAETGTIAGRVVDTSDAPVGAAIVTLEVLPDFRSQDRQHVLTDDQGAFAFGGLARGRYRLRSEKRGYQFGDYPPSRSDGWLTALDLSDNERQDITVVMPRNAVVSGAVTDETGNPMPHVRVFAVQQISSNLSARPSPSRLYGEPPGQSAMTDDGGRYQIENLWPAEYLIQTSQVTLAIADPAAGAQDRALAYAPALRGGAPGQPLTLHWGDRVSADLQLVRSPGVSVIGVMKPAARGIRLALVPRLTPPIAASDPRALTPAWNGSVDGFRFPSVPAGDYTLDAITVQDVTWDGAVHQNVANGVPANLEPTMWASMPVTIGTKPTDDLVLSLRPGMRVTGRLTYVGSSPAPRPEAIRTVWMEFFRTDGGRLVAWQIQIRVEADGSFVAAGLTPGRWQVRASITGYWSLKSVTLAGLDVMDKSFAVGTEDLRDLVLTFTDRSGRSSHFR